MREIPPKIVVSDGGPVKLQFPDKKIVICIVKHSLNSEHNFFKSESRTFCLLYGGGGLLVSDEYSIFDMNKLNTFLFMFFIFTLSMGILSVWSR